jgi:hypothetical protein
MRELLDARLRCLEVEADHLGIPDSVDDLEELTRVALVRAQQAGPLVVVSHGCRAGATCDKE